jgi:hypothetical protein
MISHNETQNGKHYWAINKDFGMMIVLKTRNRYQVCGAWACGIDENEINIIEEIAEPDGYRGHNLYYA